jgi:hypothetical protein
MKFFAFLGFLAFVVSLWENSMGSGIAWPNVNWNSGAWPLVNWNSGADVVDGDKPDVTTQVNWNS